MHRLPIAEPRSFSDSNRYLIFFLLVVLAVLFSHLAIAVGADVHKSLVVLAFTKPVRWVYVLKKQSIRRRLRLFGKSSPTNPFNFSGSISLFLAVATINVDAN